MGRVLMFLGAFVLHVYVLVDIVRSPGDGVRILSKALWLLVSLLPLIGPVAWLVAGRPLVGPGSSGGGPGGGSGGIGGAPRPGRGPVAPDDDPEFLKRLDEQSWAAKMERLRREREAGGPQQASPDDRREGEAGAPTGEPPADRI